MATRKPSSRVKKMTDKGLELLERNLRGKCASSLRGANTVANKLRPLLNTAVPGSSDVHIIQEYFDAFEKKLSDVQGCHAAYVERFSGDLLQLAEFNDWFRPQFAALQTLHVSARDWMNNNAAEYVDLHVSNSTLDYDYEIDDIEPDESVSQVGVSSHASRSSGRSGSSKGSFSSSVKSARVKESLKKVTLMAEASVLAKKQSILRKEFELSLEKQSFELSTKLAIATAKEDFLLGVGAEGSDVSSCSSKHTLSGRTNLKPVIDHSERVVDEVCHSPDRFVAQSDLHAARHSVKFSDVKTVSPVLFSDASLRAPFPANRSSDGLSAAPVSVPGSGFNDVDVPGGLQSHLNAQTQDSAGNMHATTSTPAGNFGQYTSPNPGHTMYKLSPTSPVFVPRCSTVVTSSFGSNVRPLPNGAGVKVAELSHSASRAPLPGPAVDVHSTHCTQMPGFPREVHSTYVGDNVDPPRLSDVGAYDRVSCNVSSSGVPPVGTQFGDVVEKLADVIKDQRNRLPEVTISTFSGNPLEYNLFMRSFDSRIASRTDDDRERLYFLEQYTSGTPREIVRSCIMMPHTQGYIEARRLLDTRYGDKYLIAQSYLKQLESWQPIRSDDTKKLDQFTTFLVGCRNAMTSAESIRELDYPTSLRLIVSKLPVSMQDRWSRTADTIMHQEGRAVTFENLVLFLEKENRIRMNPLFGRVSADPGKDVPGSKKKAKAASTVVSKQVVSSPTVVSPTENAFQAPCMFCALQHAFSSCSKFKRVLHKNKVGFLMKHKLCFSCLGLGHVKSDCPKRATCEVCGSLHPTILHRAAKTGDASSSQGSNSSRDNAPVVPEPVVPSAHVTQTPVSNGAGATVVPSAHAPQTPVSNAATAASQDLMTMPVVPVKVRWTSVGKEVMTYAFLDSGSTDSFITQELMDQLGVSGKKITISLSTVNAEKVPTECFAVSNLEVSGLRKECFVSLPTVYSQDSLPVSEVQIPLQEDIRKWPYLSKVFVPPLDASVGLLIGSNVPKATEPWDIVHSVGDGPYAVETILGWSINGPLRNASGVDDNVPLVSVNRIQVHATDIDQQLQNFFNQDFSERHVFDDERALSVEDSQFLEMVEGQSGLKQGHYEICLPLRGSAVPLPNNRSLAVQRLKGLRKKFNASDSYRQRYTQFVDDLFVKGHASRVPESDLGRDDGLVWYLPHHGVIHPRKDKLRVVLDASARFAGTSLNDCLLSGPDLSSTLVGVLLRFRQERVAFISDLECMFYQVKVPDHQRDLLRFLWWPDGDTSRDVLEYRMHAHIFGATSSPAVAKYALRRTALDNAESFSSEAVKTVLRSFYVDDCLKSVPSVQQAVTLASELRELTQRGGFRLTQWVSNSREVLNSLPDSERAKNVKAIDLVHDDLPPEKALGVLWRVESDSFGFRIGVLDKPSTRRGILSIVSSVYDPLGMVSPFTLMGKMIIQDLCRMKLGWDERVPDDVMTKWQQWLCSLKSLDHFFIPRCYRPEGFGTLSSMVLHHFADASEHGYGCVSYLRLVDDDGSIHCSFLMGKARVAPLKQMTIPRMELAASTLAVRIDVQLRKELDMTLGESVFWSDSTSVLGYVSNESARFHIFVANRVAVIRENTCSSQWRYVPSSMNPADYASRGLDGESLLSQVRWRLGPEFLWESTDRWPSQPEGHPVDQSDPEVRHESVCSMLKVEVQDVIPRILSHFSCWFKLKRFVALLRRSLLAWRHRKSGAMGSDLRLEKLSVSDLATAELVVLRWAQEMAYPEEMSVLRSGGSDDLKRSSKLSSLDPVLMDDVLRVGGRLRNSPVAENLRHPIIVPKDSPVAQMIIRAIHREVGHGGRDQVLARLRENYWVVHGNLLTRAVLRKCTICRKKFARPLSQKMADLPVDRVSPDLPPFTNVGVDYFGPFLVKQGRSLVKRYGVLFTCLVSRAVHLEMSVSLETDAFINSLRRFIARRGQVRMIRSDNGTNFVGAERELRHGLQSWNQSLIESSLLQKNVDWVFNAPGASHQGGAWERLIRSTRRVLLGTLKEQTLTDDSLVTLFAEVEAILNGRPLTRASNDPRDLDCLTPGHLLTSKTQQVLPPSVFDRNDNYARRRWRQVQYLADLFWRRWCREYLPFLQQRQKWSHPDRNISIGDIVLLVDQVAPRGAWLLGRVTKVFPGADGLVRNVEVRTKSSSFVRPVTKLVMVLEGED